ncbi:hypothetical protein QOT17_007062 [Balamuthia mandrillaris]
MGRNGQAKPLFSYCGRRRGGEDNFLLSLPSKSSGKPQHKKKVGTKSLLSKREQHFVTPFFLFLLIGFSFSLVNDSHFLFFLFFSFKHNTLTSLHTLHSPFLSLPTPPHHTLIHAQQTGQT